MAPKSSRTKECEISRRSVLKKGAAAAVGTGAAALLGGDSAHASQSNTASGQQARSAAGRMFRAWVRHGTGASVEELKLLPINPRQVVIRTEATQACYTVTTSSSKPRSAASSLAMRCG